MSMPFMMLRHEAYYYIEEPEGTRIARFKAIVGREGFFKVPIAEFTFDDGVVKTVSVTPFTGVLRYSHGDLPFEIEYRNAVWYAKICIKP